MCVLGRACTIRTGVGTFVFFASLSSLPVILFSKKKNKITGNFWHPPVSSSSSSAPLKKSESTDAPTANRYASLDINLTHPIRTTQLALAAFLNPPPGREKPGPANPKRVVLVGSIAGQIANLNTPICTCRFLSFFLPLFFSLFLHMGVVVFVSKHVLGGSGVCFPTF